tara:strand:+ start:4199 stop:4492 length:294 start_codon:yes stop_codon:yes gene_type:complete
MNADIISNIGQFLSEEESFKFAILSKEWYHGLFYRKKEIITQYIHNSKLAHLLNNFCACFGENYLINNKINKLGLYACYYDRDLLIPKWFNKFIDKV